MRPDDRVVVLDPWRRRSHPPPCCPVGSHHALFLEHVNRCSQCWAWLLGIPQAAD